MSGTVRRALRRFRRRDGASAIIEFALVVPIFFMVVWAIISFGRAYQRMNTLTTSLREGARYASTFPLADFAVIARVDQIKAKVYNFSVAYGYPVDTSRVVIDASSNIQVHVKVVNYPLFAGLNFIGGLQSITVTRDALFRLEQGGS
jgi:Flp pilus assembly protein TadG